METWTPSDPSTRLTSDEDVVDQLAWPQDWTEDLATRRTKARAGLERLVQLGLPHRIEHGVRRFDPYEVFLFMRWAHHRLGDPLWAQAMAATRQAASEFLELRAPQRFELYLQRSIAVPPGRTRLHTHLLVPASDEAQHDLALRVTERADLDCRREQAMIDLRVAVGDRALVDLELELGVTVGWRGARVDPRAVEPFRARRGEHAPYLAPVEGVIRVTDRIARLAAELSHGMRTPWDAVRAFWRHLFGHLVIGRIHPHALAADDRLAATLDTGFSDCFHAAALLVALCRARQIPARLVSGQFLYTVCGTNHCWAEILVEPYGWLPCDFWSWILADGSLESEWAERFLGELDPRLVIERLPRSTVVLGPSSSGPTYALQRPWLDRGPGVAIEQRAVATGRLIYRDRVSVRRSSLPDGARGSAATRST